MIEYLSLMSSTNKPSAPAMSHDFDFLFGSWRVEHARLKQRLAQNNEWENFGGTCDVFSLLNGRANIDDNLLKAPSGEYRAASLRSFDPETSTWSIWWLDGRTPGRIDTPVNGSFHDKVGLFYAMDSFGGKAIKIRFMWSEITADSAKWQQAFSEDGGQTWETNWIMRFYRVAA